MVATRALPDEITVYWQAITVPNHWQCVYLSERLCGVHKVHTLCHRRDPERQLSQPDAVRLPALDFIREARG